MEHYFVKGQNGNWFNEKTGFYLGTSEGFFENMMDEGDWTLEDVIDHLMDTVNESLKTDSEGRD